MHSCRGPTFARRSWEPPRSGAPLQGARLIDAPLQGADLRDAQLQGADLKRRCRGLT